MSTLVSEFEAAGYVERVPDPDDARATRVRLTTKGREYGRAVRAFSRRVEAELSQAIGAARVKALRATLDLLRKHVSLAQP